MALILAFLEVLQRPTIWAMVVGIAQFLVPVWIAFILGIMVGWCWKPRWRWPTFPHCKFHFSPPSTLLHQPCAPPNSNGLGEEQNLAPPIHSSSRVGKKDNEIVGYKDLEYLCHLVERKDGGPPWKHMMDCSTQDMSYQAWQRDPETGPPQYCSRTIYEDATPELLRDFFWDDEFRLEWDNMLVHAAVLEECSTTGAMTVHWIRKFPFFCSNREYIIGRRIWESGQSYYCVTKGVPSEYIPRKDKPRRVDLFYSSWYIRAVESRKGNGKLSEACEVILFHYEDMGIPWEIAKFGVRQGMWVAVKNIGRGFRSYQKHRATKAAPLSHHALMAHINTKVDPDYLKMLEGEEDSSSSEMQLLGSGDEKAAQGGINFPKLLVIGVAVAVACSYLDRGLLTKSAIFGVARKFGNIGRRACPPTNF